MKNKLVIIKEDNKNYVCYELNEKNYLKRKFNYNKLINFISKKIDTHFL